MGSNFIPQVRSECCDATDDFRTRALLPSARAAELLEADAGRLPFSARPAWARAAGEVRPERPTGSLDAVDRLPGCRLDLIGGESRLSFASSVAGALSGDPGCWKNVLGRLNGGEPAQPPKERLQLRLRAAAKTEMNVGLA
jgi:hypothetical protein